MKPDSMSFGGGRGNGKDFNMNDMVTSSSNSASWIWIATSVRILCAGLVVTKFYKY